jgi:hypothetical protein
LFLLGQTRLELVDPFIVVDGWARVRPFHGES